MDKDLFVWIHFLPVTHFVVVIFVLTKSFNPAFMNCSGIFDWGHDRGDGGTSKGDWVFPWSQHWSHLWCHLLHWGLWIISPSLAFWCLWILEPPLHGTSQPPPLFHSNILDVFVSSTLVGKQYMDNTKPIFIMSLVVIKKSGWNDEDGDKQYNIVFDRRLISFQAF